MKPKVEGGEFEARECDRSRRERREVEERNREESDVRRGVSRTEKMIQIRDAEYETFYT